MYLTHRDAGAGILQLLDHRLDFVVELSQRRDMIM